MESVFRGEVIRLARKELRQVCVPLARDVRQLKRTVSRLTRTARTLERVAGEWSDQVTVAKSKLQASDDEMKISRLSAGLIRKLRTRLGLSQGELAARVGVSGVAVWSWETGRSKPTGENRSALVAARKLGRREAKQIIARKMAEKPAAAPAKPRRKKTRKARRARA
jgi:DNA-binding transcriptional regulator YiaG